MVAREQPHTPKQFRPHLRSWITIVCICLGLTVWGWRILTVSPLRRALPWSASEIQEWSWSDGFLPDYSYQLKARISHEHFQSYVESLKLSPHTLSRRYDQPSSPWLSWSSSPGFREQWWDPLPTLDATFVSNHGDHWTYAKYEKGYVYVKSLDH